MSIESLRFAPSPIVDVFAVEDPAIARMTAGGIHQTELEGFPPKGRKITMIAPVTFRIRDGRKVIHRTKGRERSERVGVLISKRA